MKHIESSWFLQILRHYKGVLSRLPQHPINIERRGGEAIFVPVSALIKTQPEGENNGWITDRPATNRAEFCMKSIRGEAISPPQTPLFWRLNTVSKKMWCVLGEPYHMCLIGRGVCRMATRDPPWFRKNTLYSSWKTCRHNQLHFITPEKNSSLHKVQEHACSHLYNEQAGTHKSLSCVNKGKRQASVALIVDIFFRLKPMAKSLNAPFVLFVLKIRYAQGWLSNFTPLFLFFCWGVFWKCDCSNSSWKLRNKSWQWKLRFPVLFSSSLFR